jgi:hypothetical protein
MRRLILLAIVFVMAGAPAAFAVDRASCRTVSGSALSTLAKGLAPSNLKGPGYVFASGVSALPWLIAARITPSNGLGVWITDMPPAGVRIGHRYEIRSADAAAAQWSKWTSYERLPGPGLPQALAQRVIEAELCVINPKLIIAKK